MNDAAHINLAEWDAGLKGINLELKCVCVGGMRTDSLTHWASDILTGKASMCTKAAGEMLIRRLSTKKLADEYELSMM